MDNSTIKNKINIIIRIYSALITIFLLLAFMSKKNDFFNCKIRYHNNGTVNNITLKNENDLIFIGCDSTNLLRYIHYTGSKNNLGFENTFMSSGEITMKGSLINGEKHGEWRNYHENGELESICHYNNGKEVGVWEGYLEDGTLAWEVEYKNGKKILLYGDDSPFIEMQPDSLYEEKKTK